MKLSSEVAIGLEVHVELDMNSKLFCDSSTKKIGRPNSNVCPVCLGHPGTRPVLNKKAVEYAVKLSLALNCDISRKLIFSRKTYFYPDMPKNFQITQFEEPLGKNGELKLISGKTVEIQRIHLEEDPASITYPENTMLSEYSLVDYNRAGNALIEVVTKPTLNSSKQAREFLKHLINILEYLEVYDSNKCTIRTDANISIRESGYIRTEIKNVNGIKELERAISYEIVRQKSLMKIGKDIKRETRSWNPAKKITEKMRSKETEEGYGYIIEPDLPELEIEKTYISNLKKSMPELAQQKVKRYVSEYKIKKADAEVISSDFRLAELFEKVSKKIDPGLASKWIRRELLRVVNYSKKPLRDIKFGEKEIVELLKLLQNETISKATAQKIMEKLMEKPFSPKEYVRKQKLIQLSSERELKRICRNIMSKNSEAKTDYINGKQEALHFLIGKVMKQTKGRANPDMTNRILKKELNS